MRPKLSQEVTRYLREAIVRGEYNAGERISIDALASVLGVSSMPVREALITLASEGLLDNYPRRGFRVAKMRRRDLTDVFRVHAFIEGILVEDAAPLITMATIRSLREIQQQIDDLQATGSERHAEAIESLNFRFHWTINHVADAKLLRWFLRVGTQYIPQKSYSSIPGWTAATIADHPRIISALENRNGTLARELIMEHVKRIGDLLVADLASRGFWPE